jgi:nucleoside-diphosphate kinase
MAIERTYGMIKPQAVESGYTGKIIDRIEKEGFSIVGMKKMQMTKDLAQTFYQVHSQKPFYDELVDNISAGPIVALVLEKDGAIAAWRDLMGPTDPAQAEGDALRKLFGTSISHNATHGSDAPETAQTEIKLVFPELE